MKIIQKFDGLDSVKKDLIQECLNGKRTQWKRTFILQNPTDGKIGVISLNIFERIAWSFERFFCRRNYSKLENVFHTKNIKIIFASQLAQTPKKVDNLTSEGKFQEQQEQGVEKQKFHPVKKFDEETKQEAAQGQKKENTLEETEEKREQGEIKQKEKPEILATVTFQNFLSLLEEKKPEEAEKALKSFEKTLVNYELIARAYFEQDKFLETIAILKDRCRYSNGHPIYSRYAEELCRKGKYDQVTLFIEESYDAYDAFNAKIKIFISVAKEYYKAGNLDKALEAASWISNARSEEHYEDFYYELMKDCIEKNEIDNAVVVATAWCKIFRSPSFEYCEPFSILAKKLYERRDFEKCLKFNEFNIKVADARDLYIEIAKEYQIQGKKDKALEILQTYLTQNDFYTALKYISASTVRTEKLQV